MSTRKEPYTYLSPEHNHQSAEEMDAVDLLWQIRRAGLSWDAVSVHTRIPRRTVYAISSLERPPTMLSVVRIRSLWTKLHSIGLIRV